MKDSDVITTNQEEIMDWAKQRGGIPAYFTEEDEIDIEPKLIIGFAGDDTDERVREITWEQFFEELDSRKLAFKFRQLEQGEASNYYELVNR